MWPVPKRGQELSRWRKAGSLCSSPSLQILPGTECGEGTQCVDGLTPCLCRASGGRETIGQLLPTGDTTTVQSGGGSVGQKLGGALPSSPSEVKDGGTGKLCGGVLWRAGWLQFCGVFGKLVPWVESQEGKGKGGQGKSSPASSCLRSM